MERLNSTTVDRKPFAMVAGEKPIKLTVQKQHNEDVCYRISRKMPLKSLMIDYCNHVGLVYGQVRFVYDGARLRGAKTAEELEMEDEDVIDAFNEQMGGAAGA